MSRGAGAEGRGFAAVPRWTEDAPWEVAEGGGRWGAVGPPASRNWGESNARAHEAASRGRRERERQRARERVRPAWQEGEEEEEGVVVVVGGRRRVQDEAVRRARRRLVPASAHARAADTHAPQHTHTERLVHTRTHACTYYAHILYTLIYTHILLHAHPVTRTHTHTHTVRSMHMHMYKPTPVISAPTHIYTHIRPYTLTHIDASTHLHMHAYIYSHLHLYASTHVPIHTTSPHIATHITRHLSTLTVHARVRRHHP